MTTRIDGVRGTHHTLRGVAPRKFLGAMALDTALGLGVILGLATLLGAPPRFDVLTLGLALLISSGALLGQLKFTGRTLAMRLLDIHPRDPGGESLKWVHHRLRDREQVLRERWSAGAALLVLYGPPALYWTQHPLVMTAERLEIAPYVPEKSEDWNELAFYYGLALFPRAFEGHAVLFSLPYAKGPPSRFVEKINLKLRVPDITLTLEGPKTPEGSADPATVAQCLEHFGSCLSIREGLLWRHTREMRSNVGPGRFSLQVFSIGARPQALHGLRLVAKGLRQTEERYLLLNSLGTPQSLALLRPNSESGEEASELIQKVIRTARMFDALDVGRNRALARLADTSLDRAQKTKDPIALTRALADAQSALISKISVDPKDVAPFYHLGGVALLLAKHATAMRGHPQQVLDLDQWLVTAKGLAKSAYLYAQDVNPAAEDTKRLHSIWLEAKKL